MGKSTFFNRLVEKREAIMDDMPGVTRDRHYGYAEWCGKFFTVIDTGGYVTGSQDKFEAQIRRQVEIALEECSAVIFMVDARAGLTGYDMELANIVRRSQRPVFVAANKSDTPNMAIMAAEFYALGLGEVYPVSAENGSGTGELLDEVVKIFEEEGTADPNAGIPKMAILGRPNVGKSSFLNVLLGRERSIVTEEAGTTRDAIHSRYNRFGNDFILIDTAGIRKKSKVSEDVEFYSVLRSLKALEESDVCIILVDATRGLESQDINIIGLAQKQGKGIVIMINKWDLMEKDTRTADGIKKEMNQKLAPSTYIPIFFASVANKQRLLQVIEKAVEVYHNKTKKIPTSKLNDALLPEIGRFPPPSLKGKMVQIKYITQVKAKIPTFAFFCNLPQYVQPSYKRFLENKLRENFDFEGVPVRLLFRKK